MQTAWKQLMMAGQNNVIKIQIASELMEQVENAIVTQIQWDINFVQECLEKNLIVLITKLSIIKEILQGVIRLKFLIRLLGIV